MDNNRREFLSEPFNILRKFFSKEGQKGSDLSSEKDVCLADNTSDTGSMYSDFSEDDLRMEVMRLGIEPVNMERDDMLAIIAEALKKNREDLQDKIDSDLDLQNRKI